MLSKINLHSFFSSSKVTGFSLEGGKLLSLTLQEQKEQIVVLEKKSEPLESASVDVKRLDMTAFALTGSELLIRSLEVKLTKKKDIDAVLAFQAEPILPYPVENATLQSVILEKKETATTLSLLAARKDLLENELQKISFDPEIVTAAPVALGFLVHVLFPSDHPQMVIHLGDDEITHALSLNGKILSQHTHIKGVKQLPLPALKAEVTRGILALIKQNRGTPLSEVLLTGSGAREPGVVAALQEGLEVKLSLPPDAFSLSSIEIQEYAIPLGAALYTLLEKESSLNFHASGATNAKVWRRLQLSLITFGSLVLLLSFLIAAIGSHFANTRLLTVKQEYAELLQTTERPYSQFENSFLQKNPEWSATSIQEMSTDEVMARLAFLQEETLHTPDIFPLLPDVPRVSDVLAYFGTHGSVVSSQKKPLLNIKMFDYSMVRRPDTKKPSEKYRVKVELEFSTDVPKVAREFHDALIAPNDLVDPKSEVKWSTSGDLYRTSFFLKNRPAKVENSHVQ